MSESLPTADDADALEELPSGEVAGKDAQPLCLEWNTTRAHTASLLFGYAFLVFEILFLSMLTDKFWFGCDVHLLGIPAVLAAMVIAHPLLRFLESPTVCDLVSPIWKGSPPVVYSRWLRLNDPLFQGGIRFGNRHVAWQAIDAIELTFLGNLLLRSYSVTGQRSQTWPPTRLDRRIVKPPVVLRIPFGVAAQAQQKELIRRIKSERPDATTNPRLEKMMNTKFIKATAWIQLLGALILFVVLLDLGYSSFNLLQMLKGYYLCEIDATAGRMQQARMEYDTAEQLRTHPFPLSWVTGKFMTVEPAASGLYLARADALWQLGLKSEAVESTRSALKSNPKGFRIYLRLARMLAALGKDKEAAEQLDLAYATPNESFLPQLYMVALKQDHPPKLSPEALATYNKYKKQLDDELFVTCPNWPPGGDPFLHDVWYKQDIEFIYGRLFGGK